MSRELIDGALTIAASIKEKKSILVKQNLELFEQIRQLDEMLKDEIEKIYNSPDLTRYDVVTINQSLKLENILNSSIKVGLSTKSPEEACNNYFNGNISIFFIDTDELSAASTIAFREDMKDVLEYTCYISDGINVVYWNGKNFDSKSLQSCSIKK
jgi:hypothetical protein